MRCRDFCSRLIWEGVGDIEILYAPNFDSFRLQITKSKHSDEAIFNYLKDIFQIDSSFDSFTGRHEVSFSILFAIRKNKPSVADTYFARALLKAQDIIETELNNYNKTKGEGNE